MACQGWPEIKFWGDAGYYSVVGNQNGKELMTDSRIITLDSKDQRIVGRGNRRKAGTLKTE
jgi:hypothetical protein